MPDDHTDVPAARVDETDHELNDAPPRHRWLRRIAAAAALLTLAAVTVVYVVDRRVSAALADDIAKLRAAGEPVTIDDFPPGAYDDPDNAVPVYLQAFAAHSTTRPGPSQLWSERSKVFAIEYPPFTPRWLELAAESEAANARMFELFSLARGKTKVAWPSVRDDTASPIGGAGVSLGYAAVGTLVDDALYQHLVPGGSDAVAVQRLRAAEACYDAVELYSGRFSYGWSSERFATGYTAVQQIAPALRVGVAGGADRAVLDDWLAELADERRFVALILRATPQQRLKSTMLMHRAAGPPWPMRPIETRGARRLVRMHAEEQAHLKAVLLNNASITLPAPLTAARNDAIGLRQKPNASRIFGLARYPSLGFSSNHERTLNVTLNTLVERRAATVTIATRLFYLDHKRWPTTWNDLVPAYLPRVPTNPLASGSPPMRLLIVPNGRPDGGDRPVLIVRGAFVPNAATPEPQYGWSYGSLPFRDLSRFDVDPATNRPTTFPTLPTVDDSDE